MDKKEKTPNVPNLRFPQFKEPWMNYKASELLTTVSTNSLSWEQLTYAPNSSFKNLHYGLIHNGFETTGITGQSNLLPYINPSFLPTKYTLIQDGDLILADASEDRKDVGKPVEMLDVRNQKVVSGLHTIHAKNKTNLISIGFKGFYFQSEAMKKQIFKIANGSKIFGISATNFNELNMCIPSHPEQKIIVDFMGKIESRIQTQIKIIEDYEELKSWITDQIFNREISTKKLKFLIFEITQRNKSQQQLNVLSVSNKRGFIKQSEQFEERNVASEDTSNYKVVNLGQYAYNPARINVGSIARLKNCNKGIISPMYTCFELNEEKLNPIYFDLFLKSKSFKSQLNKKLEGSVRQCLAFTGLLNMEIQLPSIQTQNNIAEKISILDSKIEVENNYLKKLEQQKKYLLNNLFI